MAWAFVFLHTPAKTFKGPPTSFGYVPLYSDNGISYYVATIVTVNYLWSHVRLDFYCYSLHKTIIRG